MSGVSRRLLLGSAAGVAVAGLAGGGPGRSVPGMNAGSRICLHGARRDWNLAMAPPNRRAICAERPPSDRRMPSCKGCWPSR